MNDTVEQVSSELYQKVVAITEEYLGPPARRFVARQLSIHLNKNAEQLTPEDVPVLITWTTATLGLLTEDQQLIREYIRKMNELIS